MSQCLFLAAGFSGEQRERVVVFDQGTICARPDRKRFARAELGDGNGDYVEVAMQIEYRSFRWALVLSAASILASVLPGCAQQGPAAPIDLRCEYLTNAMGIDVNQPRFSWVLRDSKRGELQAAYQVLVASRAQLLAQQNGGAWNSGKIASDNSIQVAYAGKPLKSGHAYYWAVRFWDSQGRVSPYSKPAHFEMGLLSRNEWKGEWIGGGGELRKSFRLPASVVRARVYITALGYYELHINGQRIGDDVLDPAFTTYPKRVLYSTYDVTPDLTQGANAVGAMLGGGWATLSPPHSFQGYYSKPALLFQMNVELAGGKTFTLASDASWKSTAGPIVSDSVYNGEIYDARRETPGWDRAGFNDSAWRSARIMPGTRGAISTEMMPPIRVVDEIVPRSITDPKPGVYVFDMGQNMSGWARLRVRGPRGTRVEMRYSELIYPNGMINRANLRSAKSRDVYILSGGGWETYHAHFTYHGFRYVEVTGFPGTPGLDSIRGEVVHTAVEATGSFVASNQILNQIQHLIHWSQLTNLFSIPTDCDQRNERQGWLGDTQVTAEEAMMNFDMAAFYTNFIRDIHDVQGPDGTITDTVPYRYGRRPADPAWGTAYPQLCWYMWQQYHDRRILEENYGGLKKYVEFLRSRAPGNLLSYSYYGDWVAIVPTPGSFVSAAYYYYDTWIVSQIASVLGHTTDAQTYSTLASEIKDAINSRYFHPDTDEYATGTQTADAMALVLGLVPPKNRGALTANLDNNIVYSHNTHLTTGFIGVKWLMLALTANGHPDVAYELATQTTYPSWGYMVKRGATTLWELWQDKSGPSMNSHDHAMFGSVGAWFYRALAGINQSPGAAGYRHMLIEPHLEENLHWASGTIHTIRGAVSSSWARSPGKITLSVSIPVGADATVLVPKEEQMTRITVSESGHAVWENNHYVSGDPGVTAGHESDDGVVFNVGSGDYRFELTCD
ncbi:MAG: family 78 glycoside hydrolase catalytic domain [Terriglobia bacterium]